MEERTVLKHKYIAGIIAIVFAIVLGGCAAPADLPERIAKADAIRQTPPEDERDSGPVIVTLSTEEEIEWAICSEGCYCYYNGSLYGYLAEDGKEIAPCIYSEATPFSEGLACVCLDGKYGYIDKNGEIALPFLYDQASPFREGTAYFSCGEEYGLIDREGAAVLRLENCDSISSFREGLAYFFRDGLYGYMDQSGKVVIPPAYDDAGYFYDGLASVRKGGFFGLIDKDGREVLAPQYSSIRREESYIIAEKEGIYYCIDGEGRAFSPGAWDSVREEGGMLLVRRDDLYGLANGNGKLILEPVYEQIVPIAGKELAIVYNENGESGVLDYAGQVRVPFIYGSIYADGGGGLRVTDRDTGKIGYLDGENLTVSIPAVYDGMGAFTEGRAMVMQDGKYGVIRNDGMLELPLEYDNICLLSDGSRAVWTGETVRLTDRRGNLILTGEYGWIDELGNVYETEERSGTWKSRNYWDRQGQPVAPGYWRYETVQGVKDTYILHDDTGNNILLKAGEEAGQSTEKEFLTNWITPEAGPFADFVKNGAIAVSNAHVEGYMDKFEDLRNEGWCFSKLYRIEGQDVLYFYAEPWKRINIECSSGLFIARDGQVEQLLDGYTGSGTLKGDQVRFLFDKEEGAWKVGTMGSWGGFGGYAYGGDVYILRDGRAEVEISFMSYNQTTGNYGDDELLEDAELFYDQEDTPYTQDTILEAGYVREYLIEGQRVPVEEFRALEEQYKYQYYLTPEW